MANSGGEVCPYRNHQDPPATHSDMVRTQGDCCLRKMNGEICLRKMNGEMRSGGSATTKKKEEG